MPTTYEQYDRLLRGQLGEDEIHAILAPSGLADWRAAYRCLLHLGGEEEHVRPALIDLLPHLLAALAGAAQPDHVLVSFERLAHGAHDKLSLFYYLASYPRAVEIMARLFAGSQFLTEILLRNPEYFVRLVEPRYLAQLKGAAQLKVEAQAAVSPPATTDAQINTLRRWQRRELLRIGTSDLLDLFDVPAVTAQLSNLADSLVQTCLELAVTQAGRPADGFAVIALGKLGGQELNYSSDIDLLFLATSDANAHVPLGKLLIQALTQVTEEGFLYRVDMRLRPWGQDGALVSSLDGYLAYLDKHARLWEKQALLKARPIAGDEALGAEFLRRTEPLLFSAKPEDVRAGVHAMKQLTESYLRQRGRDWGEVKLGEGSIRDVEFVAQYLQLAHGARQPELRSRSTLDALGRLSRAGFLPAGEYRVLADGYVFLRAVEHHLQMMHYRQSYSLPKEPKALANLAQRLGFKVGELLIARYQQHCTAIRAVYMHHLGSVHMDTPAKQRTPSLTRLREHLARMDPSYAATFDPQDIQRHAELVSQLDDERLVQVDAARLQDGRWRVTIVGYDYPGELSLICGLLFVHGLSIHDGHVFTYEPLEIPADPDAASGRQKIVDTFTVEALKGELEGEVWKHYAEELAALLGMMAAGQRREARVELAKRVAVSLHEVGTPFLNGAAAALYPIEIELDNNSSSRYTVLRIESVDTPGFLYEFTNALAFNHIYIARVTVDSAGDRVQDTLYVTDVAGRKISAPDKQRELRAATVLIKHFTHLLPLSPNPESALLHFREFLGELFERPNWPGELVSLERPQVLNALAQLLGVSDFLWDDFLRMQHANLFPVVRDVDALTSAKSRSQLQAELEAALRPVHDGPQPPSEEVPWRAVLNAFKDREMFRVDMRHILGHTQEFWDFSEELTALAEVVVNSAYHLCHEDLRSVYGTPRLEDSRTSEMAVYALGKCGGREPGFASDIELMFVYAGNGQTSGPRVITTAEFYEKVVQTFVSAIQAKREGIFEIDLQLRPYGKAGSLAVSLEAFRRYYAPGGPAWAYERQALVKLRPIAGDAELGRQVVALRDAYVYTGEPFDATAMRAMRERQIRHLVAGGTLHPKYSPGGLVDVEYLVEGLQITHGARDPRLRSTNIRQAMAALAEAGILSPDDYTQLRRAHTFLRWLIDALRVVRGNARDITIPPPDSEEFAFLARRLRYGSDVARLSDDLARYTTNVREMNARLLALA
ncbi:MAG: hypothetical protein JW850_19860 [Thermoflexales bacterium]|nr:hypothetical protein [Thermoflexales bacterium]